MRLESSERRRLRRRVFLRGQFMVVQGQCSVCRSSFSNSCYQRSTIAAEIPAKRAALAGRGPCGRTARASLQVVPQAWLRAQRERAERSARVSGTLVLA